MSRNKHKRTDKPGKPGKNWGKTKNNLVISRNIIYHLDYHHTFVFCIRYISKHLQNRKPGKNRENAGKNGWEPKVLYQ